MVARRYFRGPYVTWAQATTVVADDEQGLLLWQPVGADFECRLGPDSQMLRTGTVEAFGGAPLIRRAWRDSSVLMWHPPGQAHSVWWFFRDGQFTHWYVNLESPDHYLMLLNQTAGPASSLRRFGHARFIQVLYGAIDMATKIETTQQLLCDQCGREMGPDESVTLYRTDNRVSAAKVAASALLRLA